VLIFREAQFTPPLGHRDPFRGYSLQTLPSRWLILLAMGTPDSPVAHRTGIVHCPVLATSARPLGFGVTWPLESLHQTVWCHTEHVRWPLTSVLWLLPRTVHFCNRPLTLSDRCSAGSPDMSGAHRTVRWIIAEHAQKKPESGMSAAWCTVHRPMRHRQHTLESFAPNLFVSPTGFLSWFVLNLMHLR
jgi:hypothetical protein